VQQTEIQRNWIAATRKRFALRRGEKPATKAAQIRVLWPEIEAALAEGQSVKTIRTWLEEDAGVVLSITSLASYISRIRRREVRCEPAGSQITVQTQPDHRNIPPIRSSDPSPAAPHDPLAPAMEILRHRRFDIREVHGDGDPTDKNLI
jgi:hypothetical protein